MASPPFYVFLSLPLHLVTPNVKMTTTRPNTKESHKPRSEEQEGGGHTAFLSPQTRRYIEQNANANVKTLALRKVEGVDMAFALDQIAGLQMARKKLPSWAAVKGLVYPPHLSMEQCSGEAAAKYKANVVRRLTNGGKLVDITGGFGVDFAFMTAEFDSAVYVERQAQLCRIAQSNLCVLGLAEKTEVKCGDGIDYLKTMERASLIFVDPARRDSHGAKTFGIADCKPDVRALKEQLTDKADIVMVKLSPMLDWRKAVDDMGPEVGEVHIVSAGGECKDLLLVLSRRYNGVERVYCANDNSVFAFTPDGSEATNGGTPEPGRYLYEPNASVMKAGCFAQIERHFDIKQIEANSHLFVGDVRKDDFPGRAFVIEDTTTLNKKELRQKLNGISKANIATRNFPMTAVELRKRLRMNEGGDKYIFATTIKDKKHVLLICSKIDF